MSAVDVPKKILIIRFSSIGDIVLTTPVIRCLKNQLKDSCIHFLVKKKFSAIVHSNPYVNKVIEFENNFDNIVAEITKEQYDLVVDLHNNQRTWLLKRKTGYRFYTFPKLNFKKFLLVNFKLNLLPKKHIVNRYFEAVEKVGIINDGKGTDFFIPTQDEFDATTLPSSFNNEFVAFVNGAAHSTKKIPVSLAKRIIEQLNRPVVLLGGEKDIDNGNEIADFFPERIINLCGKLNLNQSASVIKQAKVVISPDTGLMHIAAALNKPVVSVWGNTVPDFGMYPYIPKNKGTYRIIEKKNLHCRPCSKIGFKTCPMGHFNCMNQIEPEEIVKAVNQLFKA